MSQEKICIKCRWFMVLGEDDMTVKLWGLCRHPGWLRSIEVDEDGGCSAWEEKTGIQKNEVDHD